MQLDTWVLCKIYYKPVDSNDNGAFEKNTSLEETFEENPAEMPDAQNSEPLEESPDLFFIKYNTWVEQQYALGLL